nr:unnamed protein product [Digitaria exilis]
MLAQDLLRHFERILHADPLIDEVGFLHPTQFRSLGCGQDGDSDSSPQAPEFQYEYFWCREHKLAISSEILPELYRAARDAYYNSRNDSSQAAQLMSHTKALLILCPDMLTAWNSRKMVLSEKYDLAKLMDELQLRWVLKQVAEQHQDMAELVEKESVLVKELAEVLDELKKSTKWSELHVADNCCFHYRRSLLLALLDSRLENGEDSLTWESETYQLWKDELRWDEILIRRYKGRESLWNHRRFLSQWWIQKFLALEDTCPSTTSQVDLFITQEIGLLSECLNDHADEFEESRVQAELSALYILWISKAATSSPSLLLNSLIQ